MVQNKIKGKKYGNKVVGGRGAQICFVEKHVWIGIGRRNNY